MSDPEGKNAWGICSSATLMNKADNRPIAWFGFVKPTGEKGHYLYLLFFKTPAQLPKGAEKFSSWGYGFLSVLAQLGPKGRLVDGSNSLRVLGRKPIEVEYRFDVKAPAEKSLLIYSHEVKINGKPLQPNGPRLFLVDCTQEKLMLQQMPIALPDEVPDLAVLRMDKTPQHEEVARQWGFTITRVVEQLKNKSPEVKQFLNPGSR